MFGTHFFSEIRFYLRSDVQLASFLRIETESVHHAPDSIRYVSQIIIWLFTFRFINDKRHLDGGNEEMEKNPTFDMRRVFISTQVDGILCKTVNPLHV